MPLRELLLTAALLAGSQGCGSCAGEGGAPAPGGSISPSGQKLLTTAGADSSEAVPLLVDAAAAPK